MGQVSVCRDTYLIDLTGSGAVWFRMPKNQKGRGGRPFFWQHGLVLSASKFEPGDAGLERIGELYQLLRGAGDRDDGRRVFFRHLGN